MPRGSVRTESIPTVKTYSFLKISYIWVDLWIVYVCCVRWVVLWLWLLVFWIHKESNAFYFSTSLRKAADYFYMYLYVFYVCVHVHAPASEYPHACEGQRIPSVFSSRHCPPFLLPYWKQVSHWHARLAGPWASRIPVSVFPGLEFQACASHLSFYTEFWVLNIGLCACKISPLLTVLSPHPSIFLRISILNLWLFYS